MLSTKTKYRQYWRRTFRLLTERHQWRQFRDRLEGCRVKKYHPPTCLWFLEHICLHIWKIPQVYCQWFKIVRQHVMLYLGNAWPIFRTISMLYTSFYVLRWNIWNKAMSTKPCKSTTHNGWIRSVNASMLKHDFKKLFEHSPKLPSKIHHKQRCVDAVWNIT